ncbi:9313_t:CDS:2, partial [Acaulospora morrowiae]
ASAVDCDLPEAIIWQVIVQEVAGRCISSMKSSSAKILRQCHVDWMISCNNPTPLEFFRFIQPTHKSRAFEKYRKTLEQAINFCEDSNKQLKLRNLRETVNYNSDWELWLVEKKARSIRDEVHETNVKVHQELNTLVRNGGRQKQNNENADDEE